MGKSKLAIIPLLHAEKRKEKGVRKGAVTNYDLLNTDGEGKRERGSMCVCVVNDRTDRLLVAPDICNLA